MRRWRGGAIRRFILLEELREFHLKESAGLGVEDEIDAHFQELAELVQGIAVMGEMTPRATDAVSAFGERLSSIIVAARFHSLGIERHIWIRGR